MYISGIQLKDFRNYKELMLAPGKGVNVFAGKNAQGKTNLCEAIYFCATGRSHRTNTDVRLIRDDSDIADIRLDLYKSDIRHDIRVLLNRNERKSIILDAKPISKMGQLMGTLCAVLFAPEDLRMIKDGPKERRRFMDICLSQLKPAYFYMLQSYTRTIKQKNTLLKQVRQSGNREMLDVWDEQLSESGAKIIEYRSEFIKKIQPLADEMCRYISGGDSMYLEYDCIVSAADRAAIKDGLFAAFLEHREEDIRYGQSSVGPHRDDINIYICGKNARFHASQGQQRTAVLSLKLAELKLIEKITSSMPVLLLDDVFSELDKDRQNKLVEYIDTVQSFITCTSLESIPKNFNNVNMYAVKDGRIQGIKGK